MLLTLLIKLKKTMFKNFFGKITLLNAAEATVLSFILTSLLGGWLLFIVEHNRVVTIKVPILQAVTVQPISGHINGISGEAQEQVHTFIKEEKQQGESFVDSWFTAVSALCVTGLTSTDFASYSLAGQIITMILIQMGGLGIIVFTSIFAFAVAKGLSERVTFKNLLAGILDVDSLHIVKMLKHIIFYTVLFEGGATLIMGIHLQWFVDPALINNLNPWWWAVFHSISAFNNAGFGLLNNNLMNFVYDPVINLTVAGLIILGGIGYPVLIALHTFLRYKIVRRKDQEQRELVAQTANITASNVQAKIAVYATVLLLVLGTLLPLFIEWNNPIFTTETTLSQRVLISFFQSTSTRTAGFNTIDIGALGAATLFLYMGLMFVGANPAGTGGGIKIPTMAVLYGYIKDWFKKPGEPVTLLKQRISKFAVSHAVRLFFFSILFIGFIVFFVCIAEYKYLITADPTYNFIKVLFEVFSAFGTVGLTMGFPGGVTSFSAILTPFSKVLVIITMLVGRMGPLTILAALPYKKKYCDHPLSEDFPDAQKMQIG
jgi:trk system potassium uptake protein TrkH